MKSVRRSLSLELVGSQPVSVRAPRDPVARRPAIAALPERKPRRPIVVSVVFVICSPRSWSSHQISAAGRST